MNYLVCSFNFAISMIKIKLTHFIKGCTFGYHNKEKLVEELKPKVQSNKDIVNLPPQPQVTVVPKRIQKVEVIRPR